MVEAPDIRIERRRVARQKSLLRGQIFFNNRRNVVDCIVRDISVFGARLIFSDAVSTPDVLELYIPQKEQTQRVHVIWRIGQEVGVAFEQASTGETAHGSDLAARVDRLEAELAALKRMLRKIRTDIGGPDSDVA